jgi:hypothetical protein
VRAAPQRGATIDRSLEQGFPIWAPRAITDALGVCHLPRPTSPDAVFVLAKDGCAIRVLTWAELTRAGFAVSLDAGFAVDVEVRGCFGEVMSESGGTGFIDHVHPSAGLGHDTWLDATSGGDGPVFHFVGLRAGVVEFRFTHLPLDEVLRHDTRVPNARFVAAESLDDLMLGK